MKHTFAIGLGSNVDTRAQGGEWGTSAGLIAAACDRLATIVNIERASDVYSIDGIYLNQVVVGSTELEYGQLDAMCKGIEAQMGRSELTRSVGLVPIDIDVVVYDGQVTRPRDFQAPYFQRGYGQLCPADQQPLQN